MSAGLPTHVQLKQRQSQPLQGVSSQSSQKPPTISQYSNFTGIGEARGATATQFDETSRASSIDYTNGVGGLQNNISAGDDRPIRPAQNNISAGDRPIRPAQNNISAGELPIRPAQNRAMQHLTPGVSQSEKKPGGASKLGTDDPRTLANMMKQDSAQIYEAKEEPLLNPESQLRPAVENLKSADWSKTFEACNTIRRGVLFHKQLFTHPSPMTAQIFKDITKAVDSLRSQVAKNACLTLQTMY